MSHIEEKPIHIYLKRKKNTFHGNDFHRIKTKHRFYFSYQLRWEANDRNRRQCRATYCNAKKKRQKEKESHFLVESSRPTWRPVTQCNGTDDRIRRRNFHVTRADWLRIDWPTVRCVALRFVSFSLSPARIARPDEPTKKTTINGQSGGPFLSTRCHVPRKTQ